MEHRNTKKGLILENIDPKYLFLKVHDHGKNKDINCADIFRGFARLSGQLLLSNGNEDSSANLLQFCFLA